MLPEPRHDVGEKIGLRRSGERVGEPAGMAAGERVVEPAFAFERSRCAFESLRRERGRPHAASRGLRLGEIRVARADALAFDQAARKARRERDGVTVRVASSPMSFAVVAAQPRMPYTGLALKP